MTVIAGIQSESAVLREFYETSCLNVQKVILNGFLISALGFFFVCSVFSFLLMGISDLKSIFSFQTTLLLFLLILPTQILNIQFIVLRCKNKIKKFAFLSFFDLIVSLVVSLLLILKFRQGIDSVLIGLLAGKMLSLAFSSRTFFDIGKDYSNDNKLLVQMLFYGLNSMPTVLINWLQNFSSRIFFAPFLSITEIAIIGTAYKLSAIFSIITSSFKLAWEPIAFSKMSSEKIDREWFHKSYKIYIFLMLIIALTCELLIIFLNARITTSDYRAAGYLSWFFILGHFWTGLLLFLTIGIHATRKTILLLPIFGVGLFINILTIICFSRFLNEYSAGVGFLLGNIASAVVAQKISTRNKEFTFSTKYLNFAVLFSILFVILGFFINKINI